ncbi:ATPase [Candidatus Pacearchaeota archaeon]|nr:ATPase [Candidatus Pacearchaeota archaeon]|tara:strand:- start:363 stop:1691 length:1329 start_codon:yes stop_codon:yes gene_type:complete
MEIRELVDQNPWWKDRNAIEEDYDVFKWKEKRHRWMPDLIENISLEPFALHIVSGPRQAGKTTALKLLIKNLLKDKDGKSIFYFNCENLSDYKELLEVLELYFEFKEGSSVKTSIIILDEITLPKEWYRAIKFLIDKGSLRNDVVILTGSSSIDVKRDVELFPGRRGKGKDFNLLPLSFRGFLKVFDEKLEDKLPRIKNIEDIEKKAIKAVIYEKELNNYLGKYMEYGGFPLSVVNVDRSKEEAKRTYLSWIKNAILKADRNDLIARQIIQSVIETLQTDISWESISKKIEIKSPKTVSSYLDLLKLIFSLNIIYNVDISTKKIKFGKNKKVHLRDPLLLEIFEDWSMTNAKDRKSAIAESLVVEHLVRAFPEKVFFWKNGFEIDALVLDKSNFYGFEVKWSENPKAKSLPQLKKFMVVTRKAYSKNPFKIPLSVFLCLFDL